jgi:hypothetical protein
MISLIASNKSGSEILYECYMENWSDEFKVKGEDLLKKIREIIHEGNVSRIIIKTEDGRTYLEIPVTIGVLGAILAPILAAVGALAALAANFTIEVVRREE